MLQQIDVPDDIAQPMVRRHITTGDFERITAWVHGKIEFENQPLKEVLAEFARYQHLQFDVVDSEILDERVSGVFHTADVDSLLRLLQTLCIRSEIDESTLRMKVFRIDRDRCPRSWNQP
jgi:ferric-dicitrate binding protein FerR (iron transport regulator)